MAINKKLIHFNTLEKFKENLKLNSDGSIASDSNILGTSIVFIKDAKLIWTHGQYYGYDSVSGDLKDRLDAIDATIEENELITAKALTELNETKANSANTLEGYGITDAYTKEEIDDKGLVTGVKINGTIKNPTTDGVVDLGSITVDTSNLVEKTNIKTINSTSLVGTGNIEISKTTLGLDKVDNTSDNEKEVKYAETSGSSDKAEKDLDGNVISDTYAKSSLLSSVATSGSYNDLTDKPESLKNPENLKIKVNGTELSTYDGSIAKEVDITAEGLGLTSALKYCGITTTTLTDGSTTNPIKINNIDHNATQGCVVFFEDKEFIYNGSVWEEFGYPVDMSSYATTTWVNTNYKPKQNFVSSPTASGNTTAFIDTISQDYDGKITVTKKNIDFSGYKPTQTAVSSPTTNGNTTAFIDTISQNANGVISVTKKNVDFSNYLKKTDATGANVSLSSSYAPAVFPEDTGDGEFTSLISGETLDSAIKKLDQNIANLVQEVLDDEEVYSAALTDINENKTTLAEVDSWVSQNYKPKQTAVNSPSASGSVKSFIDTISQDANGVISVTKKNVDFSGYKTTQTAVSSPSASGNATAFIDTISQNSNGVISVTKKNIDLSQYLKKSDTDGNDISLPSDFEASTYPENTGNGVFTELVPGESLSSAIQTLDKNLVEIVEETLKNEKVTAQGLSELSTVKANVSDLSAVAFSGSYNDLTDIPEIDLKISDNFSTTEYGGNIEFNSITKGDSFDTAFNKVESNISDLADKLADNEQVISASLVDLDGRVSKKQDTLTSGTNIKTINGESILGEGDIIIEGGNSNANVQAVDTSETIDDVETNTYVKYVAQTLTEEQKAQVRKNIGVGSTGNIDLTDYVKKEDLSDYYTKSEIDALLGDINTMLESIINK